MPDIAQNIAEIKSKITALNPQAKLIAVSKNHPEEAVRAAIKAGHNIFGENRVQEGTAKFTRIKKEFPETELHLIGPLQTNKVKEALGLFDVIQTLDREKLAMEFAKKMEGVVTKEFFIQVNIGEEPQKAGVAPGQAKQFYDFCTKELNLPVTGLMCIPPVGEPAFLYFALLRNISQQLSTNHQPKLSMGMSGDYEEALEMGAYYIRVGTAIFGERN